MIRPPSGSMVWWRFLGDAVHRDWRFGYCTYISGSDLVRMGRWNGDTSCGFVVSVKDIEWKRYS